ncbi:MAG: hypothetical protein HFH86_00490 [Bacilli bacterium]|jgi:hypothetical protein|nr:hypothetical protein [Bacilli bacterium]
MKKKNGFIAVSLIYSFFLVFLMLMLSSSIKNAQTRLLLGTIKEDIKNQLGAKSEFIITSLPAKNPLTNADYRIGDEVNFVGESWFVVSNQNNSVVLVLKRALNKEEVTQALEVSETNNNFFAGQCNDTSCQVRMCMSTYFDNLCYYQSNSNFVYYNWDKSIAKRIVESWFENNQNLQKVCRLQYNATLGKRMCSKDTLIHMTFHDGVQNNTGYIRIASNNEAAAGRTTWVNNNGGYLATESWTLTRQNATNGKSFIYDIKGNIRQNENVMAIRPVIEVRKS